MWFQREMVQIPWSAKATNHTCMEKADERRTYTTIRKISTMLFGLIIRREALKNMAITAEISRRDIDQEK